MLGVLSRQSVKVLFILSLTMTLSACGGGGGSGGGGTASSSSANTLVANAGPDKTVNAGDRIDIKSNVLVVGGTGYTLGNGNLEVKGTSANAKDIILISWTKTNGPSITLRSNGTTAADAYFNAPSTGTAKSITITYKLTLTTVDGTTAEDSVTFTVNRVNTSPIANAGPDATAESGNTVALTGIGADTDGTVTSYSWLQTGGETVQLLNSSMAEASFVAPDVSSDTDLEFTLSVTDNDGAITTDKVVVKLVPGDAPRLLMLFPPVGGIYKESTISVFGTVKPKTGTITSVTLTIGSTIVDATVDSEGNWRANNLAIPANTTNVTLQAIAIDSNGHTGKAISNLKTSGYSITDFLGLGSFSGLAVDAAKKVAYVLKTGNQPGDIALFPVDLTTGKKGSAISSFSNVNQGLNPIALTSLAYSAEKHVIYVGTAPADTSITSKIISIDTITGARSLVSDTTKGSGVSFGNPTGLAIGSNNTLYVSDNELNAIFAVNTETGNRTIIADKNSYDYSVAAPLFLAADNTSGGERLFSLANASYNYILQMNPLATPVTNSLVTDSTESSQGPALGSGSLGFAIDPTTNTLFVLENFGGVIKVNTTTGNRAKLMESSPFSAKLTYDTQNHLIYLLDGAPTNLFVADPFTGQKVLISRSN